MSSRHLIKHFVVTIERGSIQIARAREVVPSRTYEIIQSPPLYPDLISLEGIGLGEHTVKFASLTLQTIKENATEYKTISERQNISLYCHK